MALDFPSSPTNGQTYDNYYWDASSSAWRSVQTSPGLNSRLGSVETANATTNKSGLVPIVPGSIVRDAGTASANANGKITFSGVTTLSLNGIFSSTYTNYRFLADFTSTTTTNNLNWRLRNNGTDYSTSNYLAWGVYYDYNSGGFDTGQSIINGTAGKFGYAYAGNGTMLMGDIIEPYISTKPTGILNHQLNSGTMWQRGNHYNNTVSGDGMTWLFPNATSGVITYYGYKD